MQGENEMESQALCFNQSYIIHFTPCVILDKPPNLSGFLICKTRMRLELTLQAVVRIKCNNAS